MVGAGIDIAKLGTDKIGMSMFTGKLRWRSGILEQELAHQSYEDGQLKGSQTEWVAVPTVDPEHDNSTNPYSDPWTDPYPEPISPTA